MSRENRKVFLIGLAVAIFVAVVASQFASSSPDGLEYVAEREGFSNAAQDHDLADAPLAEYGEDLTATSWVNTAVAGFAGVVLTLAIGYGVFWLARRANRDHPESSAT
jgi:ABC-type Fe3+ transport system permease subunit